MTADHRIIRVIRGRRPKVVVIGGGTGLPVVVKNLHDQNANVTAVVTVADDGGSSGAIRDYINVVPPGDIRNVLVALSDMPRVQRDIFQYRFESTDSFFAGHAIGNLIIAALTEMRGGVFAAVQELSSMMQVDGHVYPACNTPLTLNAEFTDGSKISGEAEITAAGKRIQHVSVSRSDNQGEPEAEPEVVKAIMDADVVVLGPGSLFTSILPNLMIKNLGEAVLKTQAEVIYITNIMTQKGETDNFTDADHVRVLNRHMHENFVDTVLVNIAPVPDGYLDEKKYVEISKPVRSDYKGLREMGCRVISSDFLKLRDGGVFHDGDKVAREILNLAFQSHLKKGRD
ncbi:gluconeogenesis factor YvcK family protein [Lacticaseibacillus zhaodongensis]|uniref:gluconeogenesis factor YvcK family protein n=1 Tax=Lacticaseibacillus zhaodongensis TaxID=2668065 RepID=UPI0012D2DD73|nr:uridine diphosphate-N-acetylglucosamine-binding protein YvcK [Lacticaseibacillus zhaodongensis]